MSAIQYPREIAIGDIHIWRTQMSIFQPVLQQLEGILTADERDRANRFFFSKDRNNFITARGVLRLILARYLDEYPWRVRLAYGLRGKPELAANTSQLFFNISHSGDRALIAVAKECDVGVDVEKIDVELAPGPMTGAFSKAEQRALANIGDDKRLEAFFKCWTSKEAYVKGIGGGLTVSLKDFDVCVDPDKPAQLLRPLDRDGSSWFLHSIDEGRTYAASLATTYQNARRVILDDWHGVFSNSLSIPSDVDHKAR